MYEVPEWLQRVFENSKKALEESKDWRQLRGFNYDPSQPHRDHQNPELLKDNTND